MSDARAVSRCDRCEKPWPHGEAQRAPTGDSPGITVTLDRMVDGARMRVDALCVDCTRDFLDAYQEFLANGSLSPDSQPTMPSLIVPTLPPPTIN